MVSPNRHWTKITGFEEKIMAYKQMLVEGIVPDHTEILSFRRYRLGRPINDRERMRTFQASYDIFIDLIRNLDGLEISFEQYLDRLLKRKHFDLISRLGEIITEDDRLQKYVKTVKKAEAKIKKERKKDAET